MMPARAAAGFVFFVSTAFAARAVDRQTPVAPTSMFRGGPAHLGVHQGGGPTLLGLAWRAPTEGDVVSSPAIANGVVYVGSGDGGVYAVDLATGVRR